MEVPKDVVQMTATLISVPLIARMDPEDPITGEVSKAIYNFTEVCFQFATKAKVPIDKSLPLLTSFIDSFNGLTSTTACLPDQFKEYLTPDDPLIEIRNEKLNELKSILKRVKWIPIDESFNTKIRDAYTKGLGLIVDAGKNFVIRSGSQIETVGSCDVALGSCDVAVGSCDVAVGSCDVAVGSCDVAVGSCDVAVGSCDVAVGSCDVAVGSCDVAVGSCDVAVGSCDVAVGL